MGFAALSLLVIAAFAHASWNLLAKRAGGGAGFVWLYTLAEVLIYLPVAALAFYLTQPTVGLFELGLVAGSALLHSVYFVLLQRGYTTGDLSMVYPVARGMAPLLTVVGAIVLLGERPSSLGVIGVISVGTGVIWIGLSGRDPRELLRISSEPAFFYAIATAIVIASYSLWDGFSMQTIALSPILFQWGSMVLRLAVLTPSALRRRVDVAQTWTQHRFEVLGVSVLAPLAYILVLWAFTLAPVSLVAPAREFSIVIATAFGVLLLGERSTASRLAAAATITVGVFLLGSA